MKTTFGRLFIPVAIILLVILLLMSLCFRGLSRSFLENQVLDRLSQDAESIADLAGIYLDGSITYPEFLGNFTVAARLSQTDAVLCSPSGELLLCSDAPLGCWHQGSVIQDRDYLDRVLTQGEARDTGVVAGLYEDVRYVVCVPVTDVFGSVTGLVMVSQPQSATSPLMQSLLDIYLGISLLMVVICVAVTYFFARRQSKPLQELARTANAFGHGDLTARVHLDGNYSQEIEELALAFNNMASFLEKSEYQRQEFVANVSHELKTPMTTISGYIDGMLDGTIPPQRQEHYMRIVSDETKRLNRLVRSMLDISRLQDQGGIPEEKKTRFDLEECAGQVLITFEQKINAKRLNVEVEMPEHPVFTHANQDYITQVIYNLLDNGVKFCPEEGRLGLTIREGGNKIYVTIANDGETIPPEELPLVFDRFHKIDKSRSQNREGWGLGLYIVKTIVCSHGEDISVSSKDGRTEFTFTLPLVN